MLEKKRAHNDMTGPIVEFGSMCVNKLRVLFSFGLCKISTRRDKFSSFAPDWFRYHELRCPKELGKLRINVFAENL